MTVRIGCLGAAKIANPALFRPARHVAGADVVALAARDVDRARAMAAKRGVPKVHATYSDLVADESIDAVYVPLPNGLHAEWTIKALEAGKHVLCEKPFTANATEAEAVASAARAAGRVVMEAFHWRYHPLTARVLDLIGSGTVGRVERVEAAFCFPLLSRGDIRWQLDLAGGALMDAGCYAIHMARTLAGAGEPAVVAARAKERSPGVDSHMHVELHFPRGDVRGTAKASMWSTPKVSLAVTGDRGSIRVQNPLAPHVWHRMVVREGGRKRSLKVVGRTTYAHQLEAFVAAVETGAPIPTGIDDAVANMRVIDAAYVAAGLQPRHGTVA